MLVRNGRIEAVVGARERRSARTASSTCAAQLLAPGFIDAQVNGGGGVLFNDDPERRHHRGDRRGASALRHHRLPAHADQRRPRRGRARHRRGARRHRARRARRARHPHRRALPQRRAARRPRPEQAARARWRGRRTTQRAARRRHHGHAGAGAHHAGDHPRARAMPASSFPPDTPMRLSTSCSRRSRAGLRGFTHLFNAMSPLGSREPGAVGAALADADSWCGLIVDGHHVHPEVMKLALRAKRHERFMLVTDAMPSVGAAVKAFVLKGKSITVADNSWSTKRAGSPAPISTWRAPYATQSACWAWSSPTRCAWPAPIRRSSCAARCRAHRAGSARQLRAARRGPAGTRHLDRRTPRGRVKRRVPLRQWPAA